jgi:uncharacterized protein YndB with AHSA1/START domain
MTPDKNSRSEDTSDREIIITRSLAAPRELVFDAFTQPEHLIHWWGPRGFTITTQHPEVRPGGVWQFVMHGPDGTNYDNKIVYREIARPSRIVYSHSGGDENEPGQFVTTITFESDGVRTQLTMRAVFKNRDERDFVIKNHNAIEGGKQTIDRLAEHLQGITTAGQPPEREIVSSRVFNTSPETLFTAFSDPVKLAEWWGPKGFTNTVQEMDFSVGGKCRITLHAPNGADFYNEKVFVEIVKPEKIVFQHLQPMHHFKMTMLFSKTEDKTKLIWQMFFDSADECSKVRDLIIEANEQNYDRLENFLKSNSK